MNRQKSVLISTSRTALAVRFIHAEAEYAREASGSCTDAELAAPPFCLLRGEYAGDEEAAAPSSVALQSPASWVGVCRSRGGRCADVTAVILTASRQSTTEKEKASHTKLAASSFRLHRAEVHRRREGKPCQARRAPSFRLHLVDRCVSTLR